MRRSLIVLLVGLSVVTVDAQRVRARRIRPGPPSAAPPGATLIFSTTFPTSATLESGITRTCHATNQKTPPSGWDDTEICGSGDNITAHGGFVTLAHPNGDELTLSANFTGGAGGLGFRHWVADQHDNNGGGIKLKVGASNGGTPPGNFYLRFYIRYMAGWTWGDVHAPDPDYSKDLYGLFTTGTFPNFTLGYHADHFWVWNGPGCGSQTLCSASNTGWATTQGAATGDGLFHCRQLHIDNTGGVGAAVVQLIDDGVTKISVTNGDFGSTGGLDELVIGSNLDWPLNGAGEGSMDYDDFAISVTSMPSCPYAKGA